MLELGGVGLTGQIYPGVGFAFFMRHDRGVQSVHLVLIPRPVVLNHRVIKRDDTTLHRCLLVVLIPDRRPNRTGFGLIRAWPGTVLYVHRADWAGSVRIGGRGRNGRTAIGVGHAIFAWLQQFHR